jgi:hypothetical protein
MNGVSKPALWTGRVISGLMVAFLVFDAVIKLMNIAPVIEASKRLGLPENLTMPVAVVLLVCVVLYVLPQTAVLGAVLLTGYLGGAVAIHLRAGSSLFAESLFPVYFGVLVWLGLYLRDVRVRAMLS